jgi:hypothetical protein
MVAAIDIVKRNFDIVEGILEGQTPQQIAKLYGITDRQVYNILSDEDYRKIIESGQRDQVFMLPNANKRLETLIQSEDEKVALGAIKQVHQNTGIAPSHAPSIFINKLLIQQGNSAEDRAFRATAMAFLGLPDTQTPIDVTPNDNE